VVEVVVVVTVVVVVVVSDRGGGSDSGRSLAVLAIVIGSGAVCVNACSRPKTSQKTAMCSRGVNDREVNVAMKMRSFVFSLAPPRH
jgi:hypothetical protein